MASHVADFVVSLGTDGRVASQGSMSKVLAKDKGLSKEIDEENKEIEKAEHTVDDQQPVEESKKSDGKLIVAEEISVGHISWPACTYIGSVAVSGLVAHSGTVKLFFSSLGGNQQAIFWLLCVGTLVLSQLVDTFQTWLLGYWARQYEERDPSEVNAS